MTDVRVRPASARPGASASAPDSAADSDADSDADSAAARAARRRRLPTQGWIVLGLVLVIAVGWVVAFSPLLGVRSVQVTGTQRTTAAQVRATASITAGTPLLRLHRADIAARVAALPVVASAVVRVSYPSTVVIEVHERQAVGVTRLAGGLIGLIDDSGRQFFTQSKRPPHLPVLSSTAPTSLQTQTMGALAQVGRALPVAQLAAIATIGADGPGTVTLALRDGRTVFWGSSARNADKARILPTVLGRPGSRFDISNPDLGGAR